MKLSTKGKYGLYAMFYLAQHTDQGCQPLKSVAEIGVPEDYLEQLLGTLRRSGLVTTVRGAQGGYALAKSPEALEGPLTISDCVGDERCCHKSESCASRRVWAYLSQSINSLLQSITLRDMLNQENFDLDPLTRN